MKYVPVGQTVWVAWSVDVASFCKLMKWRTLFGVGNTKVLPCSINQWYNIYPEYLAFKDVFESILKVWYVKFIFAVICCYCILYDGVPCCTVEWTNVNHQL